MDFKSDDDEPMDQEELHEEDHSHFDNQRLKLIAEISESIGKLYTNLNALNRNIESVNLVGSQFENVYSLWSKFEQVISVPSTSANESATNPMPQTEGSNAAALASSGLATASGSGTVVDASVELPDPHLPPGVAPGGGLTSWGVNRS
ncbi:uncharacterized protein VP01_2425g2 [Puccinia sorghi]|uniref:DASH complex subunit DAD1 n=1 Tax=Puccinia sorghi TaxID=27349 RepID=A0A0L6V6I6_9BASI|nr:uncharacterized protein VP01_2425g2 [Puccinia sorghi]